MIPQKWTPRIDTYLSATTSIFCRYQHTFSFSFRFNNTNVHQGRIRSYENVSIQKIVETRSWSIKLAVRYSNFVKFQQQLIVSSHLLELLQMPCIIIFPCTRTKASSPNGSNRLMMHLSTWRFFGVMENRRKSSYVWHRIPKTRFESFFIQRSLVSCSSDAPRYSRTAGWFEFQQRNSKPPFEWIHLTSSTTAWPRRLTQSYRGSRPLSGTYESPPTPVDTV